MRSWEYEGKYELGLIMKKRKIILMIFIVILVLIVGGGSWFVMDKLNRIDYNDSADMSAGENISTEASTPEEPVEPEEEEITLISEEEMSALGITEANLTDMDIFSDSDVFNVLLL